MRALIVKTSAFGDIIHAYPVLEYLKAKLPEIEIDWVVEARMKSLVQGHPCVSRAIVIDTKAWRKNWWRPGCWKTVSDAIGEIRKSEYDVCFDLQANIKSAFITWMARARDKVGAGFKTAHEPISSIVLNRRYNPPKGINISQDSLFLVQSYFDDFSFTSNPQLLTCNTSLPKLSANWMVCPGSNWKNKTLTHETLSAFLHLCHERYQPRFVFLCASWDEEKQARLLAAEFAGAEVLCRPDLTVLQHIMGSMQLVLSMDSLPLHLAASAGVPTFSFFGPSSAKKFAPLGNLHGSFQGGCPYNETFEKRCKKLRTCPTGACLRSQEAPALFSQFSQWLLTTVKNPS